MHPNFQSKRGLSDEEVRNGQDEFRKHTADVLLPREQAAVWLELCRLRKKGITPNRKTSLFVSNCVSSVGRLSVVEDMLSCLTLGSSYLVLDQGGLNLPREVCAWPRKAPARTRPALSSSLLKKIVMPFCMRDGADEVVMATAEDVRVSAVSACNAMHSAKSADRIDAVEVELLGLPEVMALTSTVPTFCHSGSIGPTPTSLQRR